MIILLLVNFLPLALSLINRRNVVNRHDVHLGLPISPDSLSSLGNGAFSFNVDITGLQSLNTTYQPFDLNTLADWAWHSSFVGSDALFSYNYSTYNTTSSSSINTLRSIRYPTGYNSSSESGLWLHNNPHKLPLAQISLAWQRPSGAELIELQDIVNASQTLDAWVGSTFSKSLLQDFRQSNEIVTDVIVNTTVHPTVDAVAIHIDLSTQSLSSMSVPLLLRIAFPYTINGASDWSHDLNHSTEIIVNTPGRFAIERTLDSDGYRIDCIFNKSWSLTTVSTIPHVLLLKPPILESSVSTDLICLFAPRDSIYPIGATSSWLLQKKNETQELQQNGLNSLSYNSVANSSAIQWQQYWNTGAFIDLSGATNASDAFELERRIVRSLYLLRALEAGAEPPAETGLLLAGNWAGKHHGEMLYWHQAWAPYWRRSEFLSRSDLFYIDYLTNATSVAASQGYKGARWPKMTASVSNRSNNGIDVPWIGLKYSPLPSTIHDGNLTGLSPLLLWESSSGVGPLLVWQQSHTILLAEAQRREAASIGGASAALVIMNTLAPLVYATADFLASFAISDNKDVFHLYPPLFGGEESGNPLVINDPAFELVQFNNALDTAAAWKEALGEAPVPEWEAVRGHLAAPPLDPATDSPQLYANNAACACLYTHINPCLFPRLGCPSPLVSHPMTSGLHGMLNGLSNDQGKRYGVNINSLNATAASILANWSWGTIRDSPSVWGWDLPLLSLSLTRLGWTSESIVSALLLNVNKNLYTIQGINQGMGNLTAYFPGNGGTLLAIAAMSSGFDGGEPGAQLRSNGPGAIASSPVPPVGFPKQWNAITEGFIVPLT
jgi:protein-glucosylgalactosylhydroxylysine glucosidase